MPGGLEYLGLQGARASAFRIRLCLAVELPNDYTVQYISVLGLV